MGYPFERLTLCQTVATWGASAAGPLRQRDAGDRLPQDGTSRIAPARARPGAGPVVWSSNHMLEEEHLWRSRFWAHWRFRWAGCPSFPPPESRGSYSPCWP
ncbi:hypothetical protein GCM10009738_31230 [Kitasatospora viridis]